MPSQEPLSQTAVVQPTSASTTNSASISSVPSAEQQSAPASDSSRRAPPNPPAPKPRLFQLVQPMNLNLNNQLAASNTNMNAAKADGASDSSGAARKLLAKSQSLANKATSAPIAVPVPVQSALVSPPPATAAALSTSPPSGSNSNLHEIGERVKQLLTAAPASNYSSSPVWKPVATAGLSADADAPAAFGLVPVSTTKATATASSTSTFDSPAVVVDTRLPEPRTPTRAQLDSSRTAIVRPLSMAVASAEASRVAAIGSASAVAAIARTHTLAVPVLSASANRHSGVFPGTPLEATSSTLAQVGVGVAFSPSPPITDTNLDEDLEAEREPQPRYVHYPRRNPPAAQLRAANANLQPPAAAAGGERRQSPPRLQFPPPPPAPLPVMNMKMHHRASTAAPGTGGTHYVLFSARAHRSPNAPPFASSARHGGSSDNLNPLNALSDASAAPLLPTATSSEFSSTVPNSTPALSAQSNGSGSPRMPAMGAASRLLGSSKKTAPSKKKTGSPDELRVRFCLLLLI